MTAMFRPAHHIKEGTGVFVALTGTTNSGKTFSALKLARGIAGQHGKIAVVDTEGGRTLHLKNDFEFDAMVMSPPFRPNLFADAAIEAERAGYAALVIDSWTQEWKGLGGVLDWIEEELEASVKRSQANRNETRTEYQIRDAYKFTAMIKPKSAHKSMVSSLLQRRIPIVFSIRGEESVKPVTGKQPEKVYKTLTDKNFPFEMSVAFRMDPTRKGYLDLSDPLSFKMEGAHEAIFKHGDRVGEEHGAALLAWSKGLDGKPNAIAAADPKLASEGDEAASRGVEVLQAFWGRLTPEQKTAAGGKTALAKWKLTAAEAAKTTEDVT